MSNIIEVNNVNFQKLDSMGVKENSEGRYILIYNMIQ